MRNGIYHVKFSSSMGKFGEGLAVFKDGKVNGGDQGYLYIGSYDGSNPSSVTAKLKIKRWNASWESIIGNIPEFELSLTGTTAPDGNSFSVTGKSPAIPAQVQIQGQFLADVA
jgi:hypothetical protein